MAQKIGGPAARDQVVKAFRQLLDARTATGMRPATKEEAAERRKDAATIEAASAYTVEAIVKGLAELQLDFGESVGTLAERLLGEAAKADEIRRAVEIENRRLAELQNVRLAADALDILVHEHEAERRAFEARGRERREKFEAQRSGQRAAWDQDQARFESSHRDQAEALRRDRRQAEEDYAYETERQRKADADAYSERRSAAERELDETGLEREHAWAERERLVAERGAKAEEHRARAEALPAELEAAVQKARADAMRETAESEQIKAELLEREVAASERIGDMRIESLTATVAQQAARIDALTAQLQSALAQSQELAMRAVEGAASKGAQPGRGE